MSGVIVWSELVFSLCTGGDHSLPDLSVFSLYIRAMSNNLLFSAALVPFVLQLFIFIPVVYIAWCAYSSLFELRLFNYYHMVGHNMSDSNSLLFSAAYLCRLTAPMAYNFMQMSHYDNTKFVAVMGKLDVDGLGINDLGYYFQMYFPVLLLPFILMTLFDVYTKIMTCLHIKRFQFTDDFDHSLISDGQEILREERERRIRVVQGKEEIPPPSGRSSATERAETAAATSLNPQRNTRGIGFDRGQEMTVSRQVHAPLLTIIL